MSRSSFIGFRAPIMVAAWLCLAACASYSGRGLQPGVATLAEVVATMGEPAMRWDDPDGRIQLAYPRGPAAAHTFMVFISPQGRLERIQQVLEMEYFARIENGKSTKADVLRLLGPPYPGWTAYFKSRDELVWEWLFCDGWNQLAKFDVLFDGTTGIVRTTYQRPDQVGLAGSARACGH